jgi:hypothetical protein
LAFVDRVKGIRHCSQARPNRVSPLAMRCPTAGRSEASSELKQRGNEHKLVSIWCDEIEKLKLLDEPERATGWIPTDNDTKSGCGT